MKETLFQLTLKQTLFSINFETKLYFQLTYETNFISINL